MSIFRGSDRRSHLARAILAIMLACQNSALAVAATEPKPALAARVAVAPGESASMQRTRRATLSAARSWAYQLRISDLAPLARSNADLLVIDNGYAARHNGKLRFEASEITSLKAKPDGGRRPVLAYLSIGEAEQYRPYWQAGWCKRATAPSWMGAVNPNWPGNYPVRFWDPGWQQLILDPVDGYLAKIQTQGFDGVYLDRTDVYSEWPKERPTAERDMIAFLTRIATAARARDPHFLVVMQNAEELLIHSAVRRLVDGIGKEDLLHGIAFTEAPNDAGTIASALGYLRRARAAGIPVFAVEYIADPARIASARQRLAGYGFVATFAPRLLDRLDVGPSSAPPPAAAVQPLAQLQPPSAPNWGEGGPTCLLD